MVAGRSFNSSKRQVRKTSFHLLDYAIALSIPRVKAELLRLARGYRLLADQADKNAQTAIVYETPANDIAG